MSVSMGDPRPEGGAVERRRPDHYRVVCISLYREDLERVDRIVRELKAKGLRRANRSSVIRAALVQVERNGVTLP